MVGLSLQDAKQIRYNNMEKTRLVELLSEFPSKRMVVIGDLCLDSYWSMDLSIEERSVETGKLNEHYVRRTYSPGGASNVVWNLADVGTKPFAAGVIGEDEFGRILLEKFQEMGTNSELVLVTPERTTPTYIKVVDSKTGEEIRRMDMVANGGKVEQIPEDIADRLLCRFQTKLANNKFDAVIVNDQLTYGLSSTHYIDRITDLANTVEIPFIVDTRYHPKEYGVEGMIMKLNSLEALTLAKEHHYRPLYEIPQEEVVGCLPHIYRKTKRAIFVTRGADGMLVYDEHKGPILVPGVKVEGEIDPVGAGDTVISAIASALASSATYEEAAIVANLAAAVTVKKLRVTGTAKPEEILEVYDNIRGF